MKPVYTKIQVVFDAAEPEKLAQFWALALGYITQPLPEGFTSLEEFFRSIGIPEEEFGDQWALIDPGVTGRGCTSSGYPKARPPRTASTSTYGWPART